MMLRPTTIAAGDFSSMPPARDCITAEIATNANIPSPAPTLIINEAIPRPE